MIELYDRTQHLLAFLADVPPRLVNGYLHPSFPILN
jgi:hypothetical protein